MSLWSGLVVSPPVAEDDAEGVADRIGEDPEACLAFTRDARGAEGEKFLLRPVSIVHADIQVHLLGIGWIWPAWRSPGDCALEGQFPQSRPGTDDYPVAGVLVDDHSQYLAVEPGQGARVGAVDHCFLEASDHIGSIPACDGPADSRM